MIMLLQTLFFFFLEVILRINPGGRFISHLLLLCPQTGHLDKPLRKFFIQVDNIDEL